MVARSKSCNSAGCETIRRRHLSESQAAVAITSPAASRGCRRRTEGDLVDFGMFSPRRHAIDSQLAVELTHISNLIVLAVDGWYTALQLAPDGRRCRSSSNNIRKAGRIPHLE